MLPITSLNSDPWNCSYSNNRPVPCVKKPTSFVILQVFSITSAWSQYRAGFCVITALLGRSTPTVPRDKVSHFMKGKVDRMLCLTWLQTSPSTTALSCRICTNVYFSRVSLTEDQIEYRSICSQLCPQFKFRYDSQEGRNWPRNRVSTVRKLMSRVLALTLNSYEMSPLGQRSIRWSMPMKQFPGVKTVVSETEPKMRF